MWVLERRLRAAGYHPSLFGYFVTVSDLDEIARRFTGHIERVLAADAAHGGTQSHTQPGYAIVSHSLGGVITRLASPRLPPGLVGCVMLAPPNRPPTMARAMSESSLYRLLTRGAGRMLTDPGFYDELPVPEVPILVIAGTGGPRAAWLPFRGEINDTILRLDETRLEGVPTLEVPAVHTFLMNRADVFDAIREFFTGQAAGVC